MRKILSFDFRENFLLVKKIFVFIFCENEKKYTMKFLYIE